MAPKARAPQARLRSLPGRSPQDFSRNMNAPAVFTRPKSAGLRPEYERASRRRLFHSPSRSRFRPPHPLTFGFRLRPPGGASIYSRPVLDASGTLGSVAGRCKGVQKGHDAFCELFFFQHFHSDSSNLWRSSSRLSTDGAADSGGRENVAAHTRQQLSTCPQALPEAGEKSVIRADGREWREGTSWRTVRSFLR